MTTREKIIVGVMCLTIVYGAYELSGSRKPGSTAPPSRADSVGELKKFVMEVTRKLVGQKPAEEYQYIITQADAQWSKDPFIHSAAPLKKSLVERVGLNEPVDAQQPPDIIYTGFMQTGDIKLAILNGIEYAEGESLNIGDYYVKEIDPTRAVIGTINGPGTIQLPIAEFDSAIGK